MLSAAIASKSAITDVSVATAARLAMTLLAELKRRNVLRVAALYLAASWLVLQITDVLGSLLD